MLHVPLNFKNNLTVDALVDSRACVSAIAQIDLDTRKQKAPNTFIKMVDPLKFQIQVANGQLEKPLATVKLKIEIGVIIIVENFVAMKNLRANSRVAFYEEQRCSQ